MLATLCWSPVLSRSSPLLGSSMVVLSLVSPLLCKSSVLGLQLRLKCDLASALLLKVDPHLKHSLLFGPSSLCSETQQFPMQIRSRWTYGPGTCFSLGQNARWPCLWWREHGFFLMLQNLQAVQHQTHCQVCPVDCAGLRDAREVEVSIESARVMAALISAEVSRWRWTVGRLIGTFGK